jgi:hypothetical protein
VVTAAQHKHTSSTSHPSTTSRDVPGGTTVVHKNVSEQHKAHATQVLALEEQLHGLNVKVDFLNGYD